MRKGYALPQQAILILGLWLAGAATAFAYTVTEPPIMKAIEWFGLGCLGAAAFN